MNEPKIFWKSKRTSMDYDAFHRVYRPYVLLDKTCTKFVKVKAIFIQRPSSYKISFVIRPEAIRQIGKKSFWTSLCRYYLSSKQWRKFKGTFPRLHCCYHWTESKRSWDSSFKCYYSDWTRPSLTKKPPIILLQVRKILTEVPNDSVKMAPTEKETTNYLRSELLRATKVLQQRLTGDGEERAWRLSDCSVNQIQWADTTTPFRG